MAILLLLASVRTTTYAARWNDRLTLYQRSFDEQPDSVQLGLLLAMELRKQGNLDQSATVLAQACERNPDYWRNWYLSAQVAFDRGDLETAHRMVERAWQLNPQLVAFLGLRDDINNAQRATTQPATTRKNSD